MKSVILNRGLEPFTERDYIVDSLPSLIFTPTSSASRLYYYDFFISVGRTRIAQIVRSYPRLWRAMVRVTAIVWMDMDTKLPMRVDLLDRDGETGAVPRWLRSRWLRISAATCRRWRRRICRRRFAPAAKTKFNWSPSCAARFSEVSSSRRPLPTMDNPPIESRLF